MPFRYESENRHRAYRPLGDGPSYIPAPPPLPASNEPNYIPSSSVYAPHDEDERAMKRRRLERESVAAVPVSQRGIIFAADLI